MCNILAERVSSAVRICLLNVVEIYIQILHTYAYVNLNMKALKQGSVKIIFLGNNPSTCIILYHTG